MILVAGVTASVLIQTMNNLQQQALKTGVETLREISGGVEVTQVSGYAVGTAMTQLAIFITPMAASDTIDLTQTYVALSDSDTKVILNFTSSCFSSSATNGLFNTIDSSNLTSSSYGLLVIRDVDHSCTASTPTINERDLVVLIINATKCFSGIAPRTYVFGNIQPEYGISGVIGFTTPSAYINTIVDLQP